jgi:hypothetical protein
MSCLSELLHGRDNELACARHWITSNPILPIVGPYVSATVIFITFLATLRLTRKLKQSDTFIEFTNTFNEFMSAREILRENRVPVGQTAPSPDQLAAKAREFYGRFYGFNFSEYYAYKTGSLDRAIFTLWMRSRWREFAAPEDKEENLLHTQTYKHGWKHWREHYHRGATDDFTRLVEDIRSCTSEHRVPGLVRYYGPSLQPLYWLVRWPFVEARHRLPRLVSDLWTYLKTALNSAWEAIRRRKRVIVPAVVVLLLILVAVYFWRRYY